MTGGLEAFDLVFEPFGRPGSRLDCVVSVLSSGAVSVSATAASRSITVSWLTVEDSSSCCLCSPEVKRDAVVRRAPGQCLFGFIHRRNLDRALPAGRTVPFATVGALDDIACPFVDGHSQVGCPPAQWPHLKTLEQCDWICPGFWHFLRSFIGPSRHNRDAL
jgi:hypothetical protein